MRVYGVDEAFVVVRLKAASVLEGMTFGNKLPNSRTESTRMTLNTTMRTSVSPGAVMNDGRWWEAAG